MRIAFMRLLEQKSDCAIDEQSHRRKWEDRGGGSAGAWARARTKTGGRGRKDDDGRRGIMAKQETFALHRKSPQAMA